MIPSATALFRSSDPLEAATWVSVDDLVALGRAKRRVLLNITNGKWKFRIAGKGKNGKNVYLVALESLPEDLQRRWLAMRHQPSPTEAEPSESPEQTPLEELKADHQLNEALKRLSTLIDQKKLRITCEKS